MQWTPTTTVTLPLLSMLAGLFAGVVGVGGGGMVQGPLVRVLDYKAEVAVRLCVWLCM